jgi:hypothetical protein
MSTSYWKSGSTNHRRAREVAVAALCAGALLALAGCKPTPLGGPRSVYQEVYLALSFAADEAGATKTDTAIMGAINEINKKGWPVFDLALVWGPVFVTDDDGVTANTMYAVHNSATFGSHETIVVIAGTNPRSLFDWLIEDAFVFETSPWDPNDPRKGVIADGTRIGLTILQGMQTGGDGLTLLQFLQSSNPGLLTVTGHSLGGALAPDMALYLYENRASFGSPEVDVYAFAGPTPGDQLFARYYNNVLGATTLRGWNTLDIVPHAWNQTTTPQLSEVPGLYNSLPPPYQAKPDLWIELLVDILKGISSGTNYTQPAQQTQQQFTSTYYTDVSQCDTELGKFIVQAVYQHVNAYALTLIDSTNPEFKNPEVTCAEVNALERKLRAKLESFEHTKGR